MSARVLSRIRYRDHHIPTWSLFILALSACTGDAGIGPEPPTPRAPASLVVITGAGQSATVATPVSTRPAVAVHGLDGTPLSGVVVTFASSHGGGSVSEPVQTTDASGIATVGGWILGSRAGLNKLTASVVGLTPVEFTADGIAGPAYVIEIHAGERQSASPGAFLPAAPAIVVEDQHANPVAGVSVVFTPTLDSGFVVDSVQVTGIGGVAEVGEWALGPALGTHTLSVRLQTPMSGAMKTSVTFQATAVDFGAVPPNYKNQLIAYFQAWFAAAGDGSPPNRWVNWAWGVTPAPGQAVFDLYPDVQAYRVEDLYQTNLGILGTGDPSRLFSSDRMGVVDQHFQWMRDHGIDGAELQHHWAQINNPDGPWDVLPFRAWRTSVTRKFRAAAEQHGRTFYISFDLHSVSNPERSATAVGDLKGYWDNEMEGNVGVTSSPAYARQNGKPVIALSGLGFDHIEFSPAQALELIRWFKQKGFYVVGVVHPWWSDHGPNPAAWRSVYAELSMIRPWMVGMVHSEDRVASVYWDSLNRTKTFADSVGIDLGTIIFPGTTTWINANPTGQNVSIPRSGGKLYWNQVDVAARLNAQVVIATFDEYNESTAIAPAAESRQQTPQNQWFVTLADDGYDMSSDSFLRLTGEIKQVLRGQRIWTRKIPIPDRLR
jgi:hypothetical protein